MRRFCDFGLQMFLDSIEDTKDALGRLWKKYLRRKCSRSGDGGGDSIMGKCVEILLMPSWYES